MNDMTGTATVHGASTPDLTSRYLGLRLRSPIVASASPLTLHVVSDFQGGAVLAWDDEDDHRRQQAVRVVGEQSPGGRRGLVGQI